MCEYCKIPGKTLAVIEAADPRIFISIQGAYLQIFNEDYPGFVENIKIKRCPMCGRDLKEKNKAVKKGIRGNGRNVRRNCDERRRT